jgi:hypothetical protein
MEAVEANIYQKKVVHSPLAIKNAFDQWLLYLAQQTQLEEGKPPCKGGCFDALIEADIQQAVANFLIWHCKKKKTDRDQTLVDWTNAARPLPSLHLSSTNHGKSKYTKLSTPISLIRRSITTSTTTRFGIRAMTKPPTISTTSSMSIRHLFQLTQWAKSMLL